MAKIQEKRSFKAINFDDANEYLEDGDTRGMLNVRVGYSENGDDGIITNVKGTKSLFNELSFSLPSGTNKCVGTCTDDQNNRLIWLNYNSNGNHGIYAFNSDSNSIDTVLVSSILNFSGSIIHSIDILNNNLAWVDENRPRAINVTHAIAGLYANTIEELITDAKVVPMIPPVCSTTTTSGSDFIQSLKSFQFIYRYVFIDGEKSAWSTVSKLVPTAYKDQHIEKITLDVSGCELFTKTPLRQIVQFVEFASRELYTFNFNQFLRITTSNLVSSNGIVSYLDTENKTPVDTAETNISFYENPIKAGSVCFQNDRKFYADCTEGYDAFLNPLTGFNQYEVPAASAQGLPSLSDCSLHVNQRYLKPGSEYNYAIEWHDKYGRKSGASASTSLAIKTNKQIGNVYKANILQFNAPLANSNNYPSYAQKMEIIRSENKTVTWFVQARANNVLYCTGYDTSGNPTYIKSNAGVGNLNTSDTNAIELHIDTSNFLQYGTNIPYTFSEGDKITFYTIGGTMDTPGSDSLRDMTIKSVRGSLLVVDYASVWNYNLNSVSVANYGTGAYFTLIGGDQGVVLASLTPAATPTAGLSTSTSAVNLNITTNIKAVCAYYTPTPTVITCIIAGENGLLMMADYTISSQSFGSWTTINTGVTTTLNAIQKATGSPSTLMVVGDNGVILKLNVALRTVTALNSRTTKNLYGVAADPNLLNSIIAVGEEGTIVQTSDTGTNWTDISSGTTCNDLRGVALWGSTKYAAVGDQGTVLYYDGSNPRTFVDLGTIADLYTISGNADTYPGFMIGGQSGYLALVVFNSWFLDEAVSNITCVAPPIDASAHYLIAGSNGGGVLYTTNNGTTWNTANSGLTDLSVTAITTADNGSNPNTTYVWVGTSSGKAFYNVFNVITHTFTGSWTEVSTGLPGSKITSLSPILPNSPSPDTVLAATDGGGVFTTLADGGGAWSSLNTGLPDLHIVAAKRGRSATVTTIGANITAMVAVQGQGIYEYDTNQSKWVASNTGITDLNVNYISELSFTYTVCTTNNGGVYFRTFGSSTWNPVKIPANVNVLSFGMGGNLDFMVGTTDGVYVSTGANIASPGWVRATQTGLPVTPIVAIAGLVNITNSSLADLFAGTSSGIYKEEGGSYPSGLIKIITSTPKKDIRSFDSYITGSNGYNGVGVGAKDQLFASNSLDSTDSVTDLSSIISSIYGSLILNYKAKIEIYSPKTVTSVIYYEYGDVYKVGSDYVIKKGGEDDGDVFFIKKDFQGTGWQVIGDPIFSMTPNSFNTVGVWDKDLGRPNTVLLYPEKQERRNIIRYSDKYVQDSKINGLSNFQETNYELIPNEYGYIRKITPIEYIILINGERESATAYIDQTVFKGANGQEVAAISDKVINNVRKLTGGFGCTNPESIVSYLGSAYWFSSNKGAFCRYNNSNGVFPISEYKARSYAFKLKKYLGTNTTLLGGYEPKFRNFIVTSARLASNDYQAIKDDFLNISKGYSVVNTSTPSSITPDHNAISQVPGGNIYMAATGSNYITVVNSITNNVVTTINIGTTSEQVIYCPFNGKLYACGGSSIVCIDPATNTVVATVTVGSNNFYMAFCPVNNYLYVSDPNDNNVHVISTISNQFITNITLPFSSPGDPIQILYIEDVVKLYCLDNTSTPCTLYCINPLTNTVETSISLTSDSIRMVYDPDNRRLYAVSRLHATVNAISVDTNTIVSTITGIGSNPFWPAYANGYLYVPSQSTSQVYIINTLTNAVSSIIAAGTGTRYCVYNPNDKIIYCSNSGTNTVTLIDSVTNTVITTLTTQTTPQYPFVGENSKTYIPNQDSNSMSIISTIWEMSETIAFQEGSNRWISKYSFIPEKFGYVKTDMFSFLNGELWKHNDSNVYNSFYGTQYKSQLNPVFNTAPSQQKNYTYLSLEANKVWSVPSMKTPEGQESFILSGHFEKIQNEWFADIKNDIHTPNMISQDEALINGDFMQSNTLNVLLETQASDLTKLRFVNVYGNNIDRVE